jgi:phosphoglycerol transferase MdoB-like AlkP superfamily enzyme
VKKRVLFLIYYFLYWLLFFGVGRIVFLTINYSQTKNFTLSTLIKSMGYALWLDGSMAGYFTLLAGLVLIGGLFYPKPFLGIIKWINHLLLGICSLAIIANAVIYTYWAGPLDISTLKYLKTPAEAAASINWILMIVPICIGICLFISFYYLFKKLPLVQAFIKEEGVLSKLKNSILLLLFAALCIIPIRGGLGVVPVNLSFVYFHKDIYPNHSAYNPVWNVLYTYTESKKHLIYHFSSQQLAKKRLNDLYTKNDLQEKWLTKNQPNVVFIVLESFLSKLIGLRENGIEITPNLNALTKSGIYFKNLYATGDRSDKGLAAIFSGLPALPKSSFIQFPKIFPKIPSVYNDFAKQGYETSFYYGGNLDFANLRSYFIATGVKNIVSNNEMPNNIVRGRWGVHDEFMFSTFLKDIKKMKTPFFTTLFTLSNHEPFDLPSSLKFGNKTGDDSYKSTAYYTDSCLGQFMQALKSSELWRQTLVVIVADHGVARLGINKIFDADKFHIPMVWTGGVIPNKQVIETICSQTDIPQFLLAHCGINSKSKYAFSSPINKKNPFAVYIYNDGIGIITPNNISIYDNISKQFQNESSVDSIMNYGKAYLQISSQFLNQ